MHAELALKQSTKVNIIILIIIMIGNTFSGSCQKMPGHSSDLTSDVYVWNHLHFASHAGLVSKTLKTVWFQFVPVLVVSYLSFIRLCVRKCTFMEKKTCLIGTSYETKRSFQRVSMLLNHTHKKGTWWYLIILDALVRCGATQWRFWRTSWKVYSPTLVDRICVVNASIKFFKVVNYMN